jgi:mycothiol synthase
MSSTEPLLGYTIRPAALDDVWAIVDLTNESNVAEIGFPWTNPEEVRDELTAPGHEERDALVAVAEDGSLVGYLTLWSDEEPISVIHQIGFVQPELRGTGLSSWLLRVGEDEARSKVARIPHLDTVHLRVSRWSTNEGAARLFAALSYRYVRTFHTLRMDLAGALEIPAPPEGITIRTFEAGADLGAVHAALADAFADHWGGLAFPPFEAWVHESIEGESSGFDPGLWFVAADGDEVVGALCARRGTAREPDIAQVDSLGVRRTWRGRGIARTLLLSAFAELAGRGIPSVELGVDAQSPTGATRLYEGVGMRVAYSHEVWEKELP